MGGSAVLFGVTPIRRELVSDTLKNLFDVEEAYFPYTNKHAKRDG